MSRAGPLEAHLGVPCSNLYGITEGLLLGSSAADPAVLRHASQGYSGEATDEISLRQAMSWQAVLSARPFRPDRYCSKLFRV